MQQRKAWAALAALAISTLVTVLVLEVVLHAIGYPRTKTGHQRFFVEHDPDRGWRNVPGAKGRFTTDEYDVLLEYSSRGIRGPERAYPKPPGTVRVVILGDSFIEGYSVPREARVAEVLEGLLSERDPGRRYEVIALGTAGYSTDQELLWLESEGLKYDPDVVVLMFYMNDVWFNGQARYWRGEKPAFVLGADGLRLTNVPVPDRRPAGQEKRDKKREGRGIKHWIRSNSKLYAMASLALENAPELRAGAARLGLVAPRAESEDEEEDGGPRVADELSVFQKEPPPATRQAWEVTGALFERMGAASSAAGAGFIAFHIPFKGVVYPESWGPILSRLGIPESDLDRDLVRQRFVEICQAKGLRCIEPTAGFQSAARAAGGERLYYVQDNHWNPGGHRLAAELLAQEIEPLLRRPRTAADPSS